MRLFRSAAVFAAPLLLSLPEVARAADVATEEAVMVLTRDTIEQAIKDHSHLVVGFYVPCLVRCKEISPVLDEAAKKIKEVDPAIVFAKMDLAEKGSYTFAVKMAITALPSFRMFEGAVESAKAHVPPMVMPQFMEYFKAIKDGVEPPPPPPATKRLPSPPLIEPEDSEVTVLTMDTFAAFITENDFAVVEFYAPGCYWCQMLFPEYNKASIELKSHDPPIKFGKIDLNEDDNKAIGKEFGVRMYPTIKIFRGNDSVDFAGRRNAASIVTYLKAERTKDAVNLPAPRQAPKRLPSPPLIESEESEVTILTKDTIEAFITENDFAVVAFCMTYSQHCKKLFLDFTKASIELKSHDPPIKLGKIDLDEGDNMAIGEEFGVHHYPTIKIFRGGDTVDFTGTRNAAGLVTYLKAERTKYAMNLPAPPQAPKRLPLPPLIEPEDSEVTVLTKDTIEAFITENDFAVVAFYVSRNHVYRRVFLEYTKASIELKSHDPSIKLGQINLSEDGNKGVGIIFGVHHGPTLKIFRGGGEAGDFSGRRDAASIVAYLKVERTKDGLNPPASPRAPTRPLALPLIEPDDIEVIVLTKDTIEAFITENDFAVVAFCVTYSSWCQRILPEYTKASIELKSHDPPIKYGKIDVNGDENKAIRTKFGIQYPTVKIFCGGGEAGGLFGLRGAASIVSYLKAAQTKVKDGTVEKLSLGEGTGYTATSPAVDMLASY